MSNLINLIRTLQTNYESEDEKMDEKLQLQLASAIGCQLPITISGGSATAVFNTTFAPRIRRLLSDINELYIIDVDQTLSVIRRVFTTRFNMVNAPNEAVDIINQLLATETNNDTDTFTSGSYARIATNAADLLKTIDLGDPTND